MTDTITETAAILSDEEVALLNQARTLLNALATRSSRADHEHIHALADVAQHAIFTTLNWMNAHRVQPLTDAQLHNNRTLEDPA